MDANEVNTESPSEELMEMTVREFFKKITLDMLDKDNFQQLFTVAAPTGSYMVYAIALVDAQVSDSEPQVH